MPRYIDADELLEEMTVNALPNDAQHLYLAMRGMVRNAPTADVAEVKRGRWLEWWDDNYLAHCHKCSECGNFPLTKEETMHDEVLSAYCPNCGAKMDGTPKERGADNPEIACLNCKHLMFSDMYGECNKQLRIVNPSDTCEFAEPKERGGEK